MFLSRVSECGEYDFVIIGAGTAGCVLANRLSERPEWNVLLLEAGSYADDDLTGIPGLWVVDSFSKFNWGFKSVPQENWCLSKYPKNIPNHQTHPRVQIHNC